MNLEYKHLLSTGFHPQSKVWVYQASRLLTLSEALEAEDRLKEYLAAWQSHGAPVKAEGHLFFGQFLVIIADETQAHIGGCATDDSTRFIRSLGQKFGIDFFDRNQLAFVVKDKIQVLPYSQLQYAIDNDFITDETLYFNNLVATRQQLEENWIIPLKDSWIEKRLNLYTK